jgi:hypothetical protein
MKKLPLTLASLALATPALAQHDTDILLSVLGSRLQTGSVTEDGTLSLDERVFHGAFGEVAPGFSDEPGFDSLPGTFAPGSRIGFTFTAALRAWDGAAFRRIPEERVAAAFGILGPVTTPPGDQEVVGFAISVSPNGEWHRHLEYTLERADGGVPEAGVYLMELTVWSTDPAVGPSRPFWIVWSNAAGPADAAAAEAWVRRTRLCPADFNGDRFVDFFDYSDFVSCFEAGLCPPGRTADFDGDGFADFFDYDAFVTAFEAGC